jgi:hypothetical protein
MIAGKAGTALDGIEGSHICERFYGRESACARDVEERANARPAVEQAK